jgi:hypothetical protein
MTTTEPTAVTALPEAAPARRVFRPAGRAAAVVLPLGAVLAAVSTIFDPPSTEPEPRGMYVAYGADPAGADVAATILHYGFLAIGVGLLLAGLAVATGRGRIWAWVGGALGGLGFLNLSGSVVIDWFAAREAAMFGPDTAMEIGAKVEAMPALTAGWMLPMVVGFTLGPILLAVGLARACVVRWWTVALPVAVAAVMAGAKGFGPLGFLVGLALLLVYGAIVGHRLWTAPRVR